jgi:hypothetical protein
MDAASNSIKRLGGTLATTQEIEQSPYFKKFQEMKQGGAGPEAMEKAYKDEQQKLYDRLDRVKNDYYERKKKRDDAFGGIGGDVAGLQHLFGSTPELERQKDKALERISKDADKLGQSYRKFAKGMPIKGAQDQSHMALTQSAGQFESLTGSFQRLASASLRSGIGADPQLEQLRKIEKNTKDTVKALGGEEDKEEAPAVGEGLG